MVAEKKLTEMYFSGKNLLPLKYFIDIFLGIKSYITWCTCSLYAGPGGGPGAAVVPRDQNMLRFTLGYARCYNPHSNLYMLLVLEHVTFVAIGHGILAYCKAAFYALQGVPLFEYL